jgi:hypothetical protein
MAGYTDPDYDFVSQVAAGATLNTYVTDNQQWQVHQTDNPAPVAVLRVDTPQALTTSTFVAMAFGTAALSRGGLVTGDSFVVPVGAAGVYEFFASVSVEASIGNKEMRIAINGDEDDWICADNRYGIATEAACRMAGGGHAYLAEGDTVDVMVFTDAPTPGNVDAGQFSGRWVGVGY